MEATKIIPANYGSIPHLSTSKLTQQADKKVNEGMEEILTKKARDQKDLIIVTEKRDGSNVGIIRKYDKILAITRSGYLAETSKYKQHHMFATYVNGNWQNFTFLPEGYRLCGEWMLQAHGTLYDVTSFPLFVAFDIINNVNERLPYLELLRWSYLYGFITVPLLHIGQPVSINNTIKLMGKGHYGITDKPEGFVYRVEREGKFDFAAKWVRPDKEDGKYMDQEIYNKGFQL